MQYWYFSFSSSCLLLLLFLAFSFCEGQNFVFCCLNVDLSCVEDPDQAFQHNFVDPIPLGYQLYSVNLTLSGRFACEDDSDGVYFLTMLNGTFFLLSSFLLRLLALNSENNRSIFIFGKIAKYFTEL